MILNLRPVYKLDREIYEGGDLCSALKAQGSVKRIMIHFNKHQWGKVYEHTDLAPTLQAQSNDNIVKVGNMIQYKRESGKVHQKPRIIESDKVSATITATDYKDPHEAVIPVLTPDRPNKKQNGRRFKDNGDDEFTLTAQGKHGVAVDETSPGVATIYYPKYDCDVAIRRLTPKEYFRLQGWSDDYFEKAAFVNSNSQLYKQAGNGVTVNVIKAIAEKMEIQ